MVVLGEVDKAFIDVFITQSEDAQHNGSFASLVGRFARIGAIKEVEGELKEVRKVSMPFVKRQLIGCLENKDPLDPKPENQA